MELTEILNLKWESLQTDSNGPEGAARPMTCGQRETWVTRTQSGLPRLLVHMSDDESAPSGMGPNAAFSAEVVSLSVGGTTRRVMDVMCLDAGLEKVFRVLCGHLIHRLAEAQAPGEAFNATVSDFLELLGAARGSSRGSLGDLGELVMLHRLAEKGAGAFETWTGPEPSRWDFRRGSAALEVKAGRRPVSSARISGEHQLEPPTDGNLWLAVMDFTADPDGQFSISALASELLIKARRQGAHKKAINKLEVLSALGREDRYELEQIRFYHVLDDLPRLRPSMLVGLPEAVSGITYKLNLDHLTEWLIDDDTHDKVMELLLCQR